MIYGGTTPTHTFTLPFDASLIEEVHIVYAQNGKSVLVKRRSDCELNGNEIVVKLSQKDTLMLDNSTLVSIQIRVLTVDGEALASDKINVSTYKCLEKVMIE